MRRIRWVLSAALLSQGAYAAECKLTSPESCEAYLNAKADSFPNIDFRTVNDEIADCADNAEFIAKCQSCVSKLERFSIEQSKYSRSGGRSHGMGMIQSNSEYLAAQEDKSRYPKGMMKIPQELVAVENEALTGAVTAAGYWDLFTQNFQGSVWAALEAQGWKRLVYYSRTVPNPPFSSMRRLLIFIPGDSFDRWIQFTLPDVTRNREANEQLVDFIAVQKVSIEGEILSTPQLHFRQYTRRYTGNRLSQLDLRSGTGDKCYSCHPSGMRPLSPEIGSVMSADQWSVMNFYNDKMASYGKAGWAGGLNIADHGPALGKNLGCTRCHGEGKERGPITWTFLNFGKIMGINSTMHKVAQDLSMPPDMTTIAFKEAVKKLSTFEKTDAEWEDMFRNITSSSNQDTRFIAGIEEAKNRGFITEAQAASFKAHISELAETGRKTYQVLDREAVGETREWLKERPTCE